MKLKNSKWTMVIAGVVVFLMLAGLVWAAPEGPSTSPSESSAPTPVIQAPVTPGLNADLLDGHHGADSSNPSNAARAFKYVWTNNLGRINWQSFPQIELNKRFLNENAGDVSNADVPNGALSPAKISGTAWTSTNDGAGSGLDADRLDGQSSSYYRNAGNMNAGTLNYARYSAYGDLGNEGRLNNNSSSDILTRSQADGRYHNQGSTRYLSVHAAAFNAQEDDWDHRVLDGFICQNSTANLRYYRAPVFLPHGATVTRMDVYYYDSNPDAGEDVGVWLNRVNHSGGYGAIAACSSSGSSTSWRYCADTSIGGQPINNYNYSYQLTLLLEDDCSGTYQHRLSSVRIQYIDNSP